MADESDIDPSSEVILLKRNLEDAIRLVRQLGEENERFKENFNNVSRSVDIYLSLDFLPRLLVCLFTFCFCFCYSCNKSIFKYKKGIRYWNNKWSRYPKRRYASNRTFSFRIEWSLPHIVLISLLWIYKYLFLPSVWMNKIWANMWTTWKSNLLTKREIWKSLKVLYYLLHLSPIDIVSSPVCYKMFCWYYYNYKPGKILSEQELDLIRLKMYEELEQPHKQQTKHLQMVR